MDAREHDEHAHPVWKVSNTLDQLDMLAEQHQHQTEHHDGLPDWPSHPIEPAGVASKTHVNVPVNFAWPKERSNSSNSSHNSAAVHALEQKETQLLPVHPTVLPPAPLGSIGAGKRHFSHAGDETSQSQRGATKRHYDSAPGDGHVAAARIEELRQETHKFLNKLAYRGPSSSSSTVEGRDTVKSSRDLDTSVSFQDPAPLYVNSIPVLASAATEQRRSDEPGTDRHWGSQYVRGRGAMPPARAATSAPPKVSSKRFTPQPQPSIFSMAAETHKQKSERHNQPPTVNLRYRTSYSDANAWIHPDATLQTAADDLKARQVLDAAAGSGTNCERRYVLSASSALRVAKESAREFLGEHLHVHPVKSGASSIGVSSAAAARASSIAQNAGPANLRVTRDEAIQTELDPCARVLQLPKLESSSQTDVIVSVPPVAAAVMPVASNKVTCKASAARKVPNRSCDITRAGSELQSSAAKTRFVHEKPKTTGVKISPQPQSTANLLLMCPRYPPEPTIFRAKSTYMTEFGRVAAKKRISVR